MTESVFADYRDKVYDHRWDVVIRVDSLVGGTPSDARKAEGWLRTKLGETRDDRIRDLVAQTMLERGVDKDTATDEVLALEHLNGFKRDENGLYVEGRQMKACIKEAANIRWPKRRWGETKKGTRSFFAEHVIIPETKLPLGVVEPTGINQRFVHTWRGSGIQYEEYVEDAEIGFTIMADYEFTQDDWGELWVTAEQQGFGSSRSQGFGRFQVIKFDRQTA